MSDYQRIFDSNSKHWSPDVEINLMFIRQQQNYWNDVLRARGHVFLNEVYASLGFTHTPAGAVVGWSLSELGLDRDIKFLVEEVWDDGIVRLEFNVEGFILDRLGKGVV